MINGITELAVTKMDVLDGLDEIKICVAYEIDGERTEIMPVDAEDLEKAVPVYETVEGWKSDTTKARSMEELPEKAVAYLDRLAELCGAPVGIVSVGPDREETFIVDFD